MIYWILAGFWRIVKELCMEATIIKRPRNCLNAILNMSFGEGGQIALQLVEVLKNCCPQAELIGVIDSYIAGKVFDGIIIEKPEVVEKNIWMYYALMLHILEKPL